jgi:hypothetical protein
MNTRLLGVVGLLLGSLSVAPGVVQAASPRKPPRVVRQAPLGAYARCDKDCPPPGVRAAPAEVWCATRPQCPSLSGCSCRLFRRKQGTADFAYAADADVHVMREPGYAYVCWCTKQKGQ